ncbi:hypothetical protein BU26DRAFT_484840 [Trematosphaeria pertusa]|uniref:Uncharacterized protein n=1 Tax=Trematosphaeria pertusa TaxID=390896 RepID=A0A6A6IGA5_9PLEO|nr:uncharacterized protein BU26DRAFT_484840 [Trematosphaeria pertusa]KAF2249436.1 hypothetical protein BU26DRAFT_484840 [Trematosphaeria pertusa]
MADAPLLGGANDTTRSTGSHRHNARSVDSHLGILRSIFKLFYTGLIAPADTTYATIMVLLNCPDPDERDKLTMQWRDHKLNELSFIGVTSPLTAVCLVSTGSWPEISSKPWFIKAIWYCGIVFAVFSVLTAAQQSLRLHRLSAHRNGLHYIRLCLVRDRKRLDSEEGQLKLVPRPFQVWSWQSSMVFLLMAVACLILGMLVLLWTAVIEDGRGIVWDEDAKLATTFTVVLVASIAFLLASQVSMMVGVAVD